MSAARRRELAALAERYGFWVVEDDPYGELWFDRPAPDAVASYSPNVIRLSSASKILAPTLRVGWMVAPDAVCRGVELLKQGADLCGSALTQQIAADLLADEGWLGAHLDKVRGIYGERATALVGAVRERFGDRVVSTDAAGGMFVVGRFHRRHRHGRVAPARGRRAGVAYVPGSAFAVRAATAARCACASPPPMRGHPDRGGRSAWPSRPSRAGSVGPPVGAFDRLVPLLVARGRARRPAWPACHTLSSAQLARMSSVPDQKPTASPAA